VALRQLRITLIYSNKNKNSTVFYQQLLQLSDDSNGLFNIEFIFSDATDITKARLTNHLLTQLLHQYKTTVLEKIWCYVCGPLDYMDTVSITLLTEGILKTHIKKEIFIPYFSERVDTPPDTLPHKVKINSKQAVYELTVQYPTSILQQALLQGIQLPYSCQSGQCGSCVARCTQGKVWMAYNEVLTEREINQGWVLTCQGYPINGDITLEY
jgi:ring-1,2-phenylacetyl-CoA epoxidase subunit PaaE